jgi:hypothetical protein
VTTEQARVIEATLANDENSTDAELVEYFTSEIGVTADEAAKAISRRSGSIREYVTADDPEATAALETAIATDGFMPEATA